MATLASASSARSHCHDGLLTDKTQRMRRWETHAEEIKREIFAHVIDVQEERRIAMAFHQEAAASSKKSFQYDDKCGSQFLHLPAPECRAGANATRWQYRWAMHGNLYAGELLRFSMVPKCLQTGVNFGDSAYFSGMVRAVELGILGEETTCVSPNGQRAGC